MVFLAVSGRVATVIVVSVGTCVCVFIVYIVYHSIFIEYAIILIYIYICIDTYIYQSVIYACTYVHS